MGCTVALYPHCCNDGSHTSRLSENPSSLEAENMVLDLEADKGGREEKGNETIYRINGMDQYIRPCCMSLEDPWMRAGQIVEDRSMKFTLMARRDDACDEQWPRSTRSIQRLYNCYKELAIGEAQI
mmetsp:Transcript_33155/g.55858  ORF Transcript_33155/g.55858 Transcript_33155/m.55858 type:complete len:126 (+) Transcript_33155:144-521(+)